MYKKKQNGKRKRNKPKGNNAEILHLQMCYIPINISSILLILKIWQKVQNTFHANSTPAEFPPKYRNIKVKENIDVKKKKKSKGERPKIENEGKNKRNEIRS